MILVAYRVRQDLPLVIAANRDEFYARPTASAHFWHGSARMLAGKDLEAGGTWLGVNERGRFAAVTNVGEPPPAEPKASRGALVQDFLSEDVGCAEYVAGISGERYRGFNLLVWDGEELLYTSNRAPTRALAPGYYGLANASLDEDRHKVDRGRSALQRCLETGTDDLTSRLTNLLADSEPPAESEGREIPGRSAAELQAMGACFITGSDYGTRASSAVTVGLEQVSFTEQLYSSGGIARGRSSHQFPRFLG
ncbi:MAG: NRDE family protein [Pseudomonadales bacterium]